MAKPTIKQPEKTASTGSYKKHGLYFLFFGVFLPLAAVLFETRFHYCAQNFFDPFPTASHVILFSLIPLSNFMVWLSERINLSTYFAFMTLASGMAMGIAVVYSLMFLPLVPASILAILYMGFGLLSLSPMLALPCIWAAGKTVTCHAHVAGTYFDPHQVKHIGHLIILIAVVAVELPSTLTRMHLSDAMSPRQNREAVRWLRQWGDKEVLLRACYERSGKATDILGSLYQAAHPIPTERARDVFYQVTGKPFNSVPIPSSARATIQHAGLISDTTPFSAGVDDEFDLDPDIAGEVVSGFARGLKVTSSEFSGDIDPNLTCADLRWQIAFENSSEYDREARAKIQLPAGAVVTDATMWVDDKPYHATIEDRSIARSAYRQLVMERKNPLLVSTCGIDQVLVQCFPIRKGHSVKWDLQIAAPMTLLLHNELLILPTFSERNFPAEVKNELHCHVVGQQDLIQSVTTNDLAHFKPIAHFPQSLPERPVGYDPYLSRVSFIDPIRPRRVEREDMLTSENLPGDLTIIVDGSTSMSPFLPAIADGLRRLPKGVKAKLVFICDGIDELTGGYAVTGDQKFNEAVERLTKQVCAGGQDDSRAILHELTKDCTGGFNVSALWIHAAQPIKSHRTRRIQRAILTRQCSGAQLYDLQVVAGVNEILDGIDANASVGSVGMITRVAPTGSLADDIERAVENRATGSQIKESSAGFLPQLHYPPCSKAAAQIDAYRTILSELQSGQPVDLGSPEQLAVLYHLVTPVSSAIVADDIEALRPKLQATDPVDRDDVRDSGMLRQFALAFQNGPMSMLNQERRAKYAQLESRVPQAELESHINAPADSFSLSQDVRPMPQSMKPGRRAIGHGRRESVAMTGHGRPDQLLNSPIGTDEFASAGPASAGGVGGGIAVGRAAMPQLQAEGESELAESSSAGGGPIGALGNALSSAKAQMPELQAQMEEQKQSVNAIPDTIDYADTKPYAPGGAPAAPSPEPSLAGQPFAQPGADSFQIKAEPFQLGESNAAGSWSGKPEEQTYRGAYLKPHGFLDATRVVGLLFAFFIMFLGIAYAIKRDR